jgi:hypothetical protein
MTTASEEILNRYKKQEIEPDAFGRAITVRKLRPSEQVALMRMADTEVTGAVNAMTVAASVYKVDDAVFTFPRSIAELNAVMDMLDEEGLTAATAAYVRLNIGQADKDGAPADAAQAAKNSPKTPA